MAGAAPDAPRSPVALSNLLIAMAAHVSRFVVRLFEVSSSAAGLAAATRVEDDLFPVRRRLLLDVLDELRVRLLALVLVLRDQHLTRQPDEQDDHDEREERAAEETIHEASVLRVAEWPFSAISA